MQLAALPFSILLTLALADVQTKCKSLEVRLRLVLIKSSISVDDVQVSLSKVCTGISLKAL